MRIKVQKWGNSLAVRIPKSIAADAKIGRGSVIDISERKGSLIITPQTEPEFSLEQLLSQITGGNIHDEVNTGTRTGIEAW